MCSPSEQTCYQLGKDNDQKNDGDSDPEQGDANRAAFIALIATVQLNEP
jgi:hypothetical protein